MSERSKMAAKEFEARGGWNPDISVAPKDGDPLLILVDGVVYLARWSEEAEYGNGEEPGEGWQVWLTDDPWYSYAVSESRVTHWHRPPKGPERTVGEMIADAQHRLDLALDAVVTLKEVPLGELGTRQQNILKELEAAQFLLTLVGRKSAA